MALETAFQSAHRGAVSTCIRAPHRCWAKRGDRRTKRTPKWDPRDRALSGPSKQGCFERLPSADWPPARVSEFAKLSATPVLCHAASQSTADRRRKGTAVFFFFLTRHQNAAATIRHTPSPGCYCCSFSLSPALVCFRIVSVLRNSSCEFPVNSLPLPNHGHPGPGARMEWISTSKSRVDHWVTWLVHSQRALAASGPTSAVIAPHFWPFPGTVAMRRPCQPPSFPPLCTCALLVARCCCCCRTT